MTRKKKAWRPFSKTAAMCYARGSRAGRLVSATCGSKMPPTPTTQSAKRTARNSKEAGSSFKWPKAAAVVGVAMAVAMVETGAETPVVIGRGAAIVTTTTAPAATATMTAATAATAAASPEKPRINRLSATIAITAVTTGAEGMAGLTMPSHATSRPAATMNALTKMSAVTANVSMTTSAAAATATASPMLMLEPGLALMRPRLALRHLRAATTPPMPRPRPRLKIAAKNKVAPHIQIGSIRFTELHAGRYALGTAAAAAAADTQLYHYAPLQPLSATSLSDFFSNNTTLLRDIVKFKSFFLSSRVVTPRSASTHTNTHTAHQRYAHSAARAGAMSLSAHARIRPGTAAAFPVAWSTNTCTKYPTAAASSRSFFKTGLPNLSESLKMPNSYRMLLRPVEGRERQRNV